METQPKRNLAPLAALAAAAIILIAAYGVLSTGGSTVTSQTLSHSSSSSEGQIQVSTTAHLASNSTGPTGLELRLSVSSNSIARGDEIGIDISVYNTLNTVNTAGPTSHSELGTSPCGGLPMGIAVFQGDYSSGNASEAQTLGIFEPGVYNCPGMLVGTTYSFAPMSDNMSINDGPQTWTSTVTENGTTSVTYGTDNPSYAEPAAASLNFTGYWIGENLPGLVDNATFVSFPPGNYTVEGVDWWGHSLFLHFQVVGNANPLTCTTIASNSSYVSETNFKQGAGDLSLSAYYQPVEENNTYLLAVSNTGTKPTTVVALDNGADNNHFPLDFTTSLTGTATWQLISPQGSFASPATVGPGTCSLIRVTPPQGSPSLSLTLWFDDNSNETITLG